MGWRMAGGDDGHPSQRAVLRRRVGAHAPQLRGAAVRLAAPRRGQVRLPQPHRRLALLPRPHGTGVLTLQPVHERRPRAVLLLQLEHQGREHILRTGGGQAQRKSPIFWGGPY
eukprot:gene552-biopygen103